MWSDLDWLSENVFGFSELKKTLSEIPIESAISPSGRDRISFSAGFASIDKKSLLSLDSLAAI